MICSAVGSVTTDGDTIGASTIGGLAAGTGLVAGMGATGAGLTAETGLAAGAGTADLTTAHSTGVGLAADGATGDTPHALVGSGIVPPTPGHVTGPPIFSFIAFSTAFSIGENVLLARILTSSSNLSRSIE
jgi:hypothetical protein